MPKPSRLAVAFAAALLCTTATAPAWGWIDTGHKVVALVAWEDLTPRTRAAVTDLLKQHPRYVQDLLSGGHMDPPAAAAEDAADGDEMLAKPATRPATAPATVPAPMVGRPDRVAFAAAAVWPDLIKTVGHPMRRSAGHSNWHYIDIPYLVGGATVPPHREDRRPGPHNVVEALTQCMAGLKDPATPVAERAMDLCWVEHLVGDVHQPLHTTTMYSPQYPKGDQGGNSEVVLRDWRYADTKVKLHLLWDSLPGDFESDELDRFEAVGLRADPRYARAAFADQLSAPADFMAWARASHELAIHDVYLDGRLASVPVKPGPNTYVEKGLKIPAVPPGYLDHAEHVAMGRVALAGYRLADLLNATFDPK